MIQSEKLKAHAKRLRLYNIANRMDSILHHAQEEKKKNRPTRNSCPWY